MRHEQDPAESADQVDQVDPAGVESTRLVTCTVTDKVAQVRLNRPEKLNALTLGTLEELIAVGRRLRRDRSLRAVILSGTGRSFSAGLDFASVNADGPAGVARAFIPRPWRGSNVFQEACWTWRRLPVPVVAAVHGHCFGGGLQLALGADLRFTTADAQWSVMEGRWGLIPDMSGIRSLSQQVGPDVAKQLTMTAEIVDGRKAAELGLATEVVLDPMARASEFVDEVKLRSPDAVAGAKRLFESRWQSSPRRSFARERLEQMVLLGAANTRRVRAAAKSEQPPTFGSRLLP